MLGTSSPYPTLFEVGALNTIQVQSGRLPAQVAQPGPGLCPDDAFAMLYYKERGRPSAPPSRETQPSAAAEVAPSSRRRTLNSTPGLPQKRGAGVCFPRAGSRSTWKPGLRPVRRDRQRMSGMSRRTAGGRFSSACFVTGAPCATNARRARRASRSSSTRRKGYSARRGQPRRPPKDGLG